MENINVVFDDSAITRLQIGISILTVVILWVSWTIGGDLRGIRDAIEGKALREFKEELERVKAEPDAEDEDLAAAFEAGKRSTDSFDEWLAARKGDGV